jgi:hypothetical protein
MPHLEQSLGALIGGLTARGGPIPGDKSALERGQAAVTLLRCSISLLKRSRSRRSKLTGIGERYFIFRQPLLHIEPRCADELTSRESLVVGHFMENKAGDDQGIGFRGRIELGLGEVQALKRAFKDVDAERRHTVANLPQRLCWKLS